MKKVGRLGWGVVAVLMAACGGKEIYPVGKVGGAGGEAGSGEDSGGKGGTGEDPGGKGGTGLPYEPCPGDLPCLPGGGSAGVSGEGCPGCELVAPAAEVLNFAVNDNAVYWIDHGTNNEFDEYNYNGTLMARDLDSGEVSTLVSGLDNPEYLGVSARYAYLYFKNQGQPLLRRYPLDAGNGAAFEDVAFYPPSQVFEPEHPSFAAAEDFSYFRIDQELHRIAETPGAEEALVFASDEAILGVAADDTRGYFCSATTLYAVDAPGAAPSHLADMPDLLVEGSQVFWLRLVDGYFYATDGRFFTRMPAAGGVWKRFAESGAGGPQVLGDYLFMLRFNGIPRTSEDHASFMRAPLSATTDRFVLTVLDTGNVGSYPWIVGRTGVYWATETGVYSVRIP